MKSDHISNNVIDNCLDRLSMGETIEDCMASYPEQGVKLKELLETSLSTMAAMSSIQFNSRVKDKSLGKVINISTKHRMTSSSFFSWKTIFQKPLFAGVTTFLLLSSLAFGATTVSNNSVPGEPLFLVKSFKENISLMLPQSDMDRAQQHIHLASVRGEEMRILLARNRLQATEEVADKMRYHLNASSGYIGLVASSNPLELPHSPAILIRNDSTRFELKSQLEENLISLKSHFVSSRNAIPLGNQQKAELIGLRAEMIYRTMMSALDETDSYTWGPFWREEPPKRRSP